MIASALCASPNLLYICLAVTRIKVEHHAGSITGLHDQVRFTSSPLHRHAREAKASKEVDSAGAVVMGYRIGGDVGGERERWAIGRRDG